MKQKNIKKSSINQLPLVIPIKLAIFKDKKDFFTHIFIFKTKEAKLTFKDLRTKLDQPIISLFREFSAPVNWRTDLTLDEELFIIENEKDLFSIYDSITRIYKKIILNRNNNISIKKIEDKLLKTMISIFKQNKNMNMKLLSEILTIPSFLNIESEIKDIDPNKLNNIINDLNCKLSNQLEFHLLEKLNDLEKEIHKKWPDGGAARKLIDVIWRLLLNTKNMDIKKRVLKFVDSKNMTLSRSALNSFQKFNCEERSLASSLFLERWKGNKVVLDNWFYFMAGIQGEKTLENIESLFKNKYFDEKSPNTLRSILNGYVINNPSFHKKDGSGYFYIAEKIIKFDSINPIVVSRFLKIFSHWESYIEPYKEKMLCALKYIDSYQLSNNTREVIDLILGK
tara:strand:- start:104 stop:1291 length:1188 start_codon:yes stop_codon:yes gene_type:complete